MKLYKMMMPMLVVGSVLVNGAAPETIFQTNCASCHGKKGENNALGMSNVIQGMSVEAFMEAVNGFAADKREGEKVAKMVKKSFVERYSAEEIKAVAEYVNQLK